MKENSYVRIEFSYTDQFDQETTLNKKLSTCVFNDMTELEMLVDEFKEFLIAAGHYQGNVDRIQIEDRSET